MSMLKSTIIAIVAAILLWIFGMEDYSLLVASFILLGGIGYDNRDNLTSKDSILGIAAMLVFMALTGFGFFGTMTATTSILVTIFVILIISWIWAAANEEYGQVVILIIVLIIFMALAPILNAWVPIAGNAAQNVNTQLGMGEKTEGTFSSIKDGIENIWLMLTDPTEWAANKDAKKGTQEGGDLALEITSVKVMPQTVMPEDEYTMMFELKNLGKNEATTVKVGARVDARALKHGSYIINSNLNDNKTAWMYLPVDDVYPQEQRFESFDIVAPNCAGTFTTTAYVEYTYNAIATTNLELINREYYDELLKHNKLQFKDQISTSSAGPFKLTIRTQYPQPIPITKTAGDINPFKIYFNAINERNGEAFINDITLELPEDLTINTDNCDLEQKGETNTYNITKTVWEDKSQCVGKNDMTSFSCEVKYDGANIEMEKTLFLTTAINYTFTYDKSTTNTVKSNVAGYLTCSEEEKIVWGDKEKIGDSDIENIKDDILASKIEGVLEDNNCDTHSVTGDDYQCSTTPGNAEAVVEGVAKACFETWAGAANSEIPCGTLELDLSEGVCDNEVIIDEDLSSINFAKITWPDGNKITDQVSKIEITYIQESCTLSGLMMDIDSKTCVVD